MTRVTMTSMLSLWIAAIVVAAAGPSQAPATTSDAFRTFMRHHYSDVAAIHAALVRGDLEAIRQPAQALADQVPPANVPADAIPFADALRGAGVRAAQATTLPMASSTAASMFTLCGECHVAADADIAPWNERRVAVGAGPEAMIGHQIAVDQLLQGLFIPSDSQWRQGAERLRDDPFDLEALPRDLAITARARTAGDRIRRVAEEAVSADSAPARAAYYAQIVAVCADCHGSGVRTGGPAAP